MSDEETQRCSTKRPRSSPPAITTIRSAATGPRTPSEGNEEIGRINTLFAEVRQLFNTTLRQLATSESAAAAAAAAAALTERTLTDDPLTEAHTWRYTTPLRDVVSATEHAQVENGAILDVNLATWVSNKDALQQQYGADFLLVESSANRAACWVQQTVYCAQQAEELAAELQRLSLPVHSITTVGGFVTHLMESNSALDAPRLYQLVRKRCAELAVNFLELAAKLPVVAPFSLTSTEAPFCGDDRTTILDTMIKTTKADLGPKESQSIHFIVGSPRLGKSRVLAEYLRRVWKEPHVRAIPITFNSETQIADRKVLRTEDEVHWQVLSRVFFSLMVEHLPYRKRDLHRIKNIGGALSWDDVHRFVDEANMGQSTDLVLVADELSKLVEKFEASQSEILMSALTHPLFEQAALLFASGFLKEDGNALSTASGRSVVPHYLAPVQAWTTDSYEPLRRLAKGVCTAGLYNKIRFVPGLMGLAVENSKKEGWKKQSALIPPLIGILSRKHPIQTKKTQLEVLAEAYLTHVANKTDASTILTLSPDVDLALDRWGVLMRYDHTSDPDAATFVPYYLLHAAGRQHLLSPFKQLFDSDLTDTTAQGKYFEALLLVALRLRAKYSLPESMCVGDLVRLLGGESLLFVGNGAVEGKLVTLGNDNVDANGYTIKSSSTLVSFPCHTETTDEQVERLVDDVGMNKGGAMDYVRGFERFVAQPTAKFNKGCDVVQVATIFFNDTLAKMALLFETRFWQNEYLFSSQDVGEKALFCLIGLLANYRGVFHRAAFVYLTTAGDTLSVNEDELRKVQCTSYAIHSEVAAIRAIKGVTLTDNPTLGELVSVANTVDPNLTFSVHVVACPTRTKDASPEFLSCMMGSLTYVCPDFELVTRLTI